MILEILLIAWSLIAIIAVLSYIWSFDILAMPCNNFCNHSEGISLEFKTICGVTKVLHNCSSCGFQIKEISYIEKTRPCPYCNDVLEVQKFGIEDYLFCNCGYFTSLESVKCPLCLNHSTVQDYYNKNYYICFDCDNRFYKSIFDDSTIEILDKKSILVYL